MYDINFDDLDGGDYSLMAWEMQDAHEALIDYLAETAFEDEMEQYYSEEYA